MRLDEDEWAQVRAHSAYSEQILARLRIFSELAFVAAAHHERLDGRSYPRGLAAGRIPLETHIITVADIFDAIRAERPYRGPIPVADAIAMMEKERGNRRRVPGCLEAGPARGRVLVGVPVQLHSEAVEFPFGLQWPAGICR